MKQSKIAQINLRNFLYKKYGYRNKVEVLLHILSLSFQTSVDGNVTESMAYFTPDIDDNEKVIMCQAENKHITSQPLYDSRILNVQC